MIDNTAIVLALRTQLATLAVVSTGSAQISATATGYARVAGSFLTDGLAVGMEVTGIGFTNPANNAAKTITALDALTVTCPGCAVEAAAARTLSVLMPAQVAPENGPALDADPAAPYLEEDYVPGPGTQLTVGPHATLEYLPMYVVKVYGLADIGITALYKYADAIVNLFAPGTPFTVGSDVLRVRADQVPFRGQAIPAAPGRAAVPVTIPLRIQTVNSR